VTKAGEEDTPDLIIAMLIVPYTRRMIAGVANLESGRDWFTRRQFPSNMMSE